MDIWLYRRMARLMHGQRTDGKKFKKKTCTDGQINEWMDGDGQTYRETDRQVDE